MMDIDGQIYLKRTPKIAPVEEDLDTLEIVEDTEDIQRDYTDEEIDAIEDCLFFWITSIDESGIELVQQRPAGWPGTTKHFNTKEEMDKEFISFKEYLDKANFIGRRWRIPGYGKDVDSLNELSDRTILFEKDHLLLVQNNHPQLGPMFEFMLLDPDAILKDSRFVFDIDKSVELYKDDRSALYSDVLTYLVSNKFKGL